LVSYVGAPVGVNVLNGGLILALMSVPIIVSIGEDSLKAVPDSFREAGIALGATKWQLIWRVLLPAAKTGLLAAVLLGVGRGVGETMAVLMATGHASRSPTASLIPCAPSLPTSPPSWRSARRIRSLPGSVPDGRVAFHPHLCRESGRGPDRARHSQKMNADANRMFTETAMVRRKYRQELLAKWMFFAMAVAMIVPLLLILGYLFVKAAPSLSLGFLLDVPLKGMTKAASGRHLSGPSIWFLSRWLFRRRSAFGRSLSQRICPGQLVQPDHHLAVINLAGVPSIVHALFGLGAFVYAARFGYSILSASLTLAIMTLPVIVASTREALASVPRSFREACWNVGATRWQAIRAVVLPNSISGILTGVILQVSRAAGETAPIMFTGAVFYKAVAKGDLFAYGLQ